MPGMQELLYDMASNEAGASEYNCSHTVFLPPRPCSITFRNYEFNMRMLCCYHNRTAFLIKVRLFYIVTILLNSNGSHVEKRTSPNLNDCNLERNLSLDCHVKKASGRHILDYHAW